MMMDVDAQLRTQIQTIRAGAGAGADVTANLTYSIGPDGQRYARGGNVVTRRSDAGRVDDRNAAAPAIQAVGNADLPQDAEEAAQSSQPLSVRSANLSDVLGGRISLSPLEFAQLFSESFNDDLQRGRLQAIDAGVRSQELLHFRAAGGLASGLPQYGTQVGPDGQLFATSGQVNIQTTATNDPRQAARNNATLAIAATAPGDASAQDIAVARSALSQAASLYQQGVERIDQQQPPQQSIAA